MIEVSKRQRANAIEAKAMWLTIPEDRVVPGLDKWQRKTYKKDQNGIKQCKTLACFGGWCAVHPAFEAQGIRLSSSGIGPVYDGPETFKDGIQIFDVDQILFGMEYMFVARGIHDAEYFAELQDSEAYEARSDWQIVMDRIDWLIENTVVRA